MGSNALWPTTSQSRCSYCKVPERTVVLAGDFNGLDDAELSTRSMLTTIVNQPTRGTNVLDKIYVNDTSYDAGKVVTPIQCAAITRRAASPVEQDSGTEGIQTSLAVTACSIFTARTSRNLRVP